MTKLTGYPAIAATPVALALALMLSAGIAPLSAFDRQEGQLHIQKDCTGYAGAAGGHCKVTVSDLAEIPVGSFIYYDQAAGVPTGLLDSNVVLDAMGGNRAVGRCTLDFSTGLGLCTFSDGTGQLAGFIARVKVSFLGGTLWAWDGTYSFKPLPDK